MTDSPSPDNFSVSEDQMGFWDALPPEPPDWGPPDMSDNSLTEESFVRPDARPDEREYNPSNTWEHYLASFDPSTSPDVLDAEQRSRAQQLNLVDARFVGVEYQSKVGEPTGYGVGCIEVYADPTKANGTSASYLEIAAFDAPLDAMALYDTLQTPVEKGWIANYSVYELADFAAGEHDMPDDWRQATRDDMAIYQWYAGHDLAFEPPLETDLSHSQETAPRSDQSAPAFNALSAIGIQAADFDPSQDPPPYYDTSTGTAYWIGIFQPDLQDPETCVASVLSLGRNPETGELEAQLAPCVLGNWDKAYDSSQHLLNVIEHNGIDACFLAAESMAVATEQRDLWETERGMSLEADYAEQAAEYTRETWELDL